MTPEVTFTSFYNHELQASSYTDLAISHNSLPYLQVPRILLLLIKFLHPAYTALHDWILWKVIVTSFHKDLS